MTNLDLVRGIATLEIFVMNAVSVGLPAAVSWNLAATGSLTGLYLAVDVVVEGH